MSDADELATPPYWLYAEFAPMSWSSWKNLKLINKATN